jgi:hypothetical protein
MRATAMKRGCGTRKAGGIYIESGLSPYGVPIEELLIDPARTFPDIGTEEWFKPHRTPILFEHKGAHHLVFWVGREFYQSVWDFIEEVRVGGASRRLPSTFDFSKITAASRMFFVHGAARVDGSAIGELFCPCPKGTHGPTIESEPFCLGVAKYAAKPDQPDGSVRTLPGGHGYLVHTPPEGVELKESPGLFLQVAVTGIAMINQRDGGFDPDVESRVRAAGVETFRTDA